MPDFVLERDLMARGYQRIAGVDEAGRGPLAGPVVAAAVVLDPDAMGDPIWRRLDDSKKMTEAAREKLFDMIRETSAVSVAIVDVDEIDIHNILGATMLGMSCAVTSIEPAVDYALIDGNRVPVLNCAGEAVVKGDGRSLSIAAASVIAKVSRDRLMRDLAQKYPGYGWERNAGYGTKQHLDALKSLGVTPEHRKSFRPVRNILSVSAD